MLTFIGANVSDPAFMLSAMALFCGVLTLGWLRFVQRRNGVSLATYAYRGLQLRMHPNLPVGKIVVLDPRGYTLTSMTTQVLDGLSRSSVRAVLLSRRDFEAVTNQTSNPLSAHDVAA
jgi:hypothetical protein